MSFPSRPCPKCRRLLEPCGVVQVEGGPEMPVYQCDSCVVPGEVLGVKMDLAVTFCTDEAGRMFDPADPETPFSAN